MNITFFNHQPPQILTVEQLDEFLRRNDGAVWIDVDASNSADVSYIQNRFGFHPLAIEDVTHQNQRPKAEEFVDHIFIILNPISQNPAHELFRELDVFVGKHYLVTAHSGSEPLLTSIWHRLEPDRLALPISSTYLLYVLMDTIIDLYLPVLERIEDRIERLGSASLENPTKDILNEIFQLKRELNEIWWVVWPQQDIINVLTNHSLVFIDEKSHYYLRDISDHLSRIMYAIQSARETVTGLVNIYMSSVSNQVNYAVGRLTLLTIIVGIITVFSGIYGMNFERTWPPFGSEWGVGVVLMMMMGTSGLAFLILRRLGWIE